MSLLKDIINEAASGDDVARLLRKCLVLAHKLNSGELSSWAKSELNGYDKAADLPIYRVICCRSQGFFVGPFNQWQGTFEIPLSVLPERMRVNYVTSRLLEPIAHFESLVADRSGKGVLMQPWPTEVARSCAPKAFIEGTQCLRAWNEISPASIVGMLDQVKSRVLEFALAIATDFPELAQGDELLQGLADKDTKVNQTFNTTIMGSVGNVAAGSTNVKQVSDLNVTSGDWNALRSALMAHGVPDAEIESLHLAISEDRDAGESGVGARVRAWLGNLTGIAMTGAGAIGVNAIGGAIAPLIGKYLGIG